MPTRWFRTKQVWWALFIAAISAAILLHLTLRSSAPICIAVANSLTGPSAPAGRESIAAIELVVDEANRSGGIDGRPIELVRFDDQSSAEGARANVPAIVDTPCVAVLGHYLSTASLAAGPLYQAARMPALTGTSFVDELTTGNPYYFRAQTTASIQGRSVAEYLDVVQGFPSVELIYSDDSFGRSFQNGFSAAYEDIRLRSWTFDPRPGARAASARGVAEALASEPDRGIIVIGTGADNIPDVLMAVRRRGLLGNVIAAGGAGGPEFLERFANEPEERRQPGYFSRNLSATPPVIFDSAGEKAQAFAAVYRRKTHREPSWIAAGAYDGARIMIEALRRANVQNRPETLDEDRSRVRVALAGINSPETGVEGLTRMLYFDDERNIPSPVRVGAFVFGRFGTSPQQLVLVEQPELLDLEQELRRNDIVAIGGRYYWRQRVVYTGIDVNRLDRIDIRQGTFTADINLWMRSVGDDAPALVEFPALVDKGAFTPSQPLEASPYTLPRGFDRPLGVGQYDVLTYRLYRIAGDFKASFDLHEYPFDEQQLLIRFQNRQQRSELVTYVIDTAGLKLANTRQRVPMDLDPFGGLQQWNLTELRYFVDSLSTHSTLGNPLRFTNNAEITFAGFNAAIVLERDYVIYVVKSLIPLVLLILVVFATLLLPQNLYRERITIPVTAILTSAVLLLSVNSQLGDVGYPVAIEYIFYTFFALCLASMVVGISHDALVIRDRQREAIRLAHAGQAIYVIGVVLMTLFFWWRYGTD